MVDLGLTYSQMKNPDGIYQYQIEPNINLLCNFQGILIVFRQTFQVSLEIMPWMLLLSTSISGGCIWNPFLLYASHPFQFKNGQMNWPILTCRLSHAKLSCKPCDALHRRKVKRALQIQTNHNWKNHKITCKSCRQQASIREQEQKTWYVAFSACFFFYFK